MIAMNIKSAIVLLRYMRDTNPTALIRSHFIHLRFIRPNLIDLSATCPGKADCTWRAKVFEPQAQPQST
jgi:hypothetical protein